MNTENENFKGDIVSRDKFQGDAVAGNKYEITAYINSITPRDLDTENTEK